VYTDRDVEGLEKGAWTTLSLENNKGNAYVDYIDRFALAAMEGRPADVPGEEGRKTLEVLEAAYRSGEIHQPVLLPM
jgi:predicted dehydrogenase